MLVNIFGDMYKNNNAFSNGLLYLYESYDFLKDSDYKGELKGEYTNITKQRFYEMTTEKEEYIEAFFFDWNLWEFLEILNDISAHVSCELGESETKAVNEFLGANRDNIINCNVFGDELLKVTRKNVFEILFKIFELKDFRQ